MVLKVQRQFNQTKSAYHRAQMEDVEGKGNRNE